MLFSNGFPCFSAGHTVIACPPGDLFRINLGQEQKKNPCWDHFLLKHFFTFNSFADFHFQRLGKESKKSGILLDDLNNFYNYCTQELSLNIIGLMCLPPINSVSNKYFQILKKSGEKFNLKELSMGMSADYEQAILNGSTYLRLGTVIFGKRIS